MKLLLFIKSTSRSKVNTCGEIIPENELNRRSKKVRLVASITLTGNSPVKLLLLRSSSYKYRRLAMLGGIFPVKLFEFAWKIAMSGNSSMKPVRVRSGPAKLKPLKSTVERAVTL